MKRLTGLGFLALAPLCGRAAAQSIDVPQNDGWVTDLAGLLSSAQAAALEETLESFKQGSGHEIAVLTVPTLDGAPIERFALEVGRTWKVGREGADDGIVLVVAKAEREMRIEVGRGIEGGLTDSISGRIIRDVIGPEFKAGRFADGLRAGVVAIHAALGGDFAPIERTSRGRPHAAPLAGIIPLLFFLFLIIALSRASRRSRVRRGGSALPWILLGSALGGGRGGGGFGGSFGGGRGFSGFGGGGGFSGGGASGRW